MNKLKTFLNKFLCFDFFTSYTSMEDTVEYKYDKALDKIIDLERSIEAKEAEIRSLKEKVHEAQARK